MKPIFTPEDFAWGMERRIDQRSEVSANTANYLINKLIKSWPIIYGGKRAWFKYKDIHSTHQARLAFFEEISLEECKHIAHRTADGPQELSINKDGNYFCAECGTDLFPGWEAKK